MSQFEQEGVNEDVEVVSQPVLEERAQEEVQASATTNSQEEKKESATPRDEAADRVYQWRNLREAKERAERERDEARRLLQEGTRKPEQPTEEELNLADDELLEHKHLKSFKKKQEQRFAAVEQQIAESQLRALYPDFDRVVNAETIAMLRDADPEIADSIAANPNLFSKASAAYKTIKRYGFAGEDVYNKQKEKVSNNINKPRPVTSISPQEGESPLSRANAFAEGLTPELAKQLWKEMQEARKKT